MFILFQDLQPRVDGRVRVRGLEIIPGVARQMRLICTKTATSSQVGKTLYLKKLYFLTAKACIARFYLTRLALTGKPQITFLKRFLGINNYYKVTRFVVDYKSFSFGIFNHTYS